MIEQNSNAFEIGGGNFFDTLSRGIQSATRAISNFVIPIAKNIPIIGDVARIAEKPLDLINGLKIRGSGVSGGCKCAGGCMCGGSAVGKKASAAVRIQLRKGLLRPFGYVKVKDLSLKQRQSALNKAVASGMAPLSLYRRLNALAVLNKRDPELEGLFLQDRDYVKKSFDMPKGGSSTSSSSTKSHTATSTKATTTGNITVTTTGPGSSHVVIRRGGLLDAMQSDAGRRRFLVGLHRGVPISF